MVGKVQLFRCLHSSIRACPLDSGLMGHQQVTLPQKLCFVVKKQLTFWWFGPLCNINEH